MVMNMPIDNFVQDENEVETYKQITRIEIDYQSIYTQNNCRTFMIFVSEKEIQINKSQVVKFFNQMDSLEKIQNLKIPIAKITTPQNKESTIEDVIKLPAKQQTFSVEFDLSYIKKL